jgi:hypothetical protein
MLLKHCIFLLIGSFVLWDQKQNLERVNIYNSGTSTSLETKKFWLSQWIGHGGLTSLLGMLYTGGFLSVDTFFLIHIRNVPGWNLGPVTTCTDGVFVVFPSSYRRMVGYFVREATLDSLHISDS